MRRFLGAASAIVIIATGVSRAGLYIPDDPGTLPVNNGKVEALPYELFRLRLHDLLGIAVPTEPTTDYRKQYVKKRDELLAKGTKNLSVSEAIALSGYFVRLQQTNEAMELLQSIRPRARENFELESHLALLAHLFSEPNATHYQLMVSKTRLKELPGMSPERVAWSLKAEKALSTVFASRAQERRDNGNRPETNKIDALFPVQFVGESGQYEAGKIAEAEKAKIPADAIATVQQLLFWLPNDSRLYWLLAELYNAAGDLDSAAIIFDECIDSRRFQPELLRDHRRKVKDEISRKQAEAAAERTRKQGEAAAERARNEAETKAKDWRNHPEVFWVIGGVVAMALVMLFGLQLRVLLRRSKGGRPKSR
jgi:hypothetical protein